ncbi:MAG: DNA helicase UvrD [Elusimicrobia bacterium]|nr:DNA helicase UvrD [Elusimicrobiota bacterium]
MYIADFHIHSKYSRATSKDMDLAELIRWSKHKGVNLLGTGDITHFLWFHELSRCLKETDRDGIYNCDGTDFILTGEVCNIFEDKKGKVKKIHLLIFLSSFAKASKLNRNLERYADLNADGRPILHMDVREFIRVFKDSDEDGFIVPAHIWTPHFSLFGSNSGFNSLYECFGDFTEDIFALETGLSSDPEMNWAVSSLDNCAFISNSDAHSPSKIGREANVFSGRFDFPELKRILQDKDTEKFRLTVEYFSEEGKYYCDGHRNCKICMFPEETNKNNNICPVCGKKMTIGVMNRIYELSDRNYGERPAKFIPFRKMVPLIQIIAGVFRKDVNSRAVKDKYVEIIGRNEPEFTILFELPEEELRKRIDGDIVDGIYMVREGRINIVPGYDGEFGKVEIPCRTSQVKNEQTLF